MRLTVLAMRARFTRLALRRRRGAAHAEFLHEEDLGEAEAAAGEFAGVVVGEEFDALLADFGEIDVPGLFAKVVHGKAGAVLGFPAGLLLLAAAVVLFAAALFFLAALLFLLTAEVFLFAPLLVLLAALLGGLIAGLRVSRLLIGALLLLGWWRRSGVGRVISGSR